MSRRVCLMAMPYIMAMGGEPNMGDMCFFIGNRDAPEGVYPILCDAVERQIAKWGIMEFVVGDYGGFDALAARSVIRAKERHPEVRLTLLLAYYVPESAVPLRPGFDASLYPEGMESVPKRAAIVRANRYMVQRSACLIVYDGGRVGNTRELVKYARQREKRGLLRIENIAEKYMDSAVW